MHPADKLALKQIRRHKPKTKEEAEAIGLKLKHLGTGAFRDAYLIVETDLVIKFSTSDMSDGFESRYHSRLDFKRLKRLREIAWLRPHLVKVHYFDSRCGVLVVDYVEKALDVDYEDKSVLAMDSMFNTLLSRATGVRFGDIGGANVRYCGKSGKIKIVDAAL
jgi:hypothetical protein